ncbi:MAG TPA: FAD-dependent oxidoreductase [Thermodesulfobacteriota bacterium]|nr:FAD-dependent oxidoreductase [Thermodesulfobacteriota bacterium]
MEEQEMTAESRMPGPGGTVALWIGTTPQTAYPSLSRDLTVDVAIIGGGIVGLTAALLLKQSGASVALLESNRIAEGVSGHTTAKITSAHGLIYQYLIDHVKEERARQYADANQAAIEFIASFLEENHISADFHRTVACTYTLEDADLPAIQKEVEAASELGLPVTYTDSLPLPFEIKGAICFENQAYFHPRKYLLALAERIPGNGSYLFEHTRVTDVKEGNSCQVVTGHGIVKAKHVVVATHFPILNRGLFFAKMNPVRSYLMAVKTLTEPPEGMYISTEKVAHTVRKHVTDAGEVYLLIGGESHETGEERDTLARYAKIESFARRHFDIQSIAYRWSTQDNQPVDRIPFIGRHSQLSHLLYVATGLKGWGMTGGTAAGMIISDLISRRPNPWSAVFDPNRFTPFLSKKFISRNIHVAKMFIKDHLPTGEKKNLQDLKPGAAGVVDKDGEQVAAFQDEQGTKLVLSSSCTHMGCTVGWNNAERSWDCPCHGSRFDVEGHVIQAPAVADLERKA